MKRSIPILFTLVTITVCGVLALAPARAQKEASGVTVKNDGDGILVVPQGQGRSFLVLGVPRGRKGQELQKALPGQLSYLEGEVRFPVKEYERILVWELVPRGEVDLNRKEPHLLPIRLRSRSKLWPPGCTPPPCPELSVYVIWPTDPAPDLKGKL